MFSSVRNYLIAKIAAAPIVTEPFPHMVIDEIFPSEFYAEMTSRRLSDDEYIRLVDTGRVSAAYSPHRLCFMRDGQRKSPDDSDVKFWESFLAMFDNQEFLDNWLKRFAPAVDRRLSTDLHEFLSPEGIHVSAECFLMRDRDGYMLSPHIDAQHKAMTALFYLPRADTNATIGTALYRCRKPAPSGWGVQCERDDFEHVETVSYLPNRMIAFPNLPDSFHGGEPVGGAQAGRDLFIYDLKYLLVKRPEDGQTSRGG